MPKTKSHKYRCLAKIGNNPDGSAKMISHHSSDLLSYTKFIDKDFNTWTWFNVYSNIGLNKGQQIGNFTKNKRPVSKII